MAKKLRVDFLENTAIDICDNTINSLISKVISNSISSNPCTTGNLFDIYNPPSAAIFSKVLMTISFVFLAIFHSPIYYLGRKYYKTR